MAKLTFNPGKGLYNIYFNGDQKKKFLKRVAYGILIGGFTALTALQILPFIAPFSVNIITYTLPMAIKLGQLTGLGLALIPYGLGWTLSTIPAFITQKIEWLLAGGLSIIGMGLKKYVPNFIGKSIGGFATWLSNKIGKNYVTNGINLAVKKGGWLGHWVLEQGVTWLYTTVLGKIGSKLYEYQVVKAFVDPIKEKAEAMFNKVINSKVTKKIGSALNWVYQKATLGYDPNLTILKNVYEFAKGIGFQLFIMPRLLKFSSKILQSVAFFIGRKMKGGYVVPGEGILESINNPHYIKQVNTFVEKAGKFISKNIIENILVNKILLGLRSKDNSFKKNLFFTMLPSMLISTGIVTLLQPRLAFHDKDNPKAANDAGYTVNKNTGRVHPDVEVSNNLKSVSLGDRFLNKIGRATGASAFWTK
ncbi:MAG: hypothetical protein J0H68_00195 [Sphingobacteriia bacterium]|nr:hypothetical protein [Sphingobacteriia bacterium]